MKAQQTRREGQTRQESRPGREANVKTELLLETTHMATSFRRQRRESLRTRLSSWSINYVISLNNFAPEEFFGWGGGRGQIRVDERSKILECDRHYEGVLSRTQIHLLYQWDCLHIKLDTCTDPGTRASDSFRGSDTAQLRHYKI